MNQRNSIIEIAKYSKMEKILYNEHSCANCHIKGHLKLCPCEIAHYCNTKCQKADWPNHRKQCHTARSFLNFKKMLNTSPFPSN
jgi:hypothetical protein